MRDTMTEYDRGNGFGETAAVAVWIALVTIGSVLGSLAFACAAPLAAMAAVAGLKMRAPEGMALVGTAWLANQIVGFLVLGYPHTFETYAWGAVLGLSAFAAYGAAALTTRLRLPSAVAIVAAFLAAFAADQAVLFGATPLLGMSETGFSSAAVLLIFQVNVVALAALLVAYWAAVQVRLLRPLAVPAAA